MNLVPKDLLHMPHWKRVPDPNVISWNYFTQEFTFIVLKVLGYRFGVSILVYCSDMNFHCVMLRKTSIAYFTNVGFFFGVNNIMPFKHIFVSKAFETNFTLVASCSLNKIVLKSRDGILGSLMFNHRQTVLSIIHV